MLRRGLSSQSRWVTRRRQLTYTLQVTSGRYFIWLVDTRTQEKCSPFSILSGARSANSNTKSYRQTKESLCARRLASSVARVESSNADHPNWDVIYLSRSLSEDSTARPIMTGDVFENVTIRTVNGEEKVKTVMVLQHPCALRSDGVELSESVLVVLVRQHKIVEPADWKKYWKLMPLPDLMPSVDSGKRNQAAFFDDTFHVHRDELRSRVACLSLRGVNLLIQRWVHHCSRVVVKTNDIDQETSGAYEEVILSKSGVRRQC